MVALHEAYFCCGPQARWFTVVIYTLVCSFSHFSIVQITRYTKLLIGIHIHDAISLHGKKTDKKTRKKTWFFASLRLGVKYNTES